MNIFVTGSIAYDTIMDFPGEFKDHFHSEKLHQINVSFVIDKLDKQLGGTATNIAYNISLISKIKNLPAGRQGQRSKISVLGSVGKDGQEFLDFFTKNKIDATGVIIDKKLYSSSGSVMTDKKNNQIWGFYYGASKNIPHTDFKKINPEDDFMIISANHKNSFMYFQAEAIKNKITYLYDPGMSLTWINDRDLRKGVEGCRYLIGNDYEIAMITKRLKVSISELTQLGIKVITTLGQEGARYVSKNESVTVPIYWVKKLVDPTGAGDAFRGGFVAGLAQNYSPRDCLKLGTVMASFSIEKYGTVNHRPTKNEIEKRLKSL